MPPDFRRMSQAIYWWPEHEGSEWPCRVFAIADESGDPLDSDPWQFFEDALGGDTEGKLRWVELPGFEYEIVHESVDETPSRRVPRGT